MRFHISIPFLALLVLGGCAFFDAEDPVVRITSHVDGDSVTIPFLLSGKASDNVDVRSVQYRVDTGEYADVDGTGKWNVLVSIGTTGEHYITVKAEDYSENTGYAYLRITVR